MSSESAPSEHGVRDALHAVFDPCSLATGAPVDIVDMGLVKSVEVREADVHVQIRLTSLLCLQAPVILAGIERAAGAVQGVHTVTCTVDHGDPWMPTMMHPDAERRLRALRPRPMRASATVASGRLG